MTARMENWLLLAVALAYSAAVYWQNANIIASWLRG